MADLTVLTTERIAADAIGGDVTVVGTDTPPDCPPAWPGAAPAPGSPVAIAGVAHALEPGLRPGELLVASELRGRDGAPPRLLPSAALLARDLQQLGLSVRCGPLLSSPTPVTADQTRALAAAGALAWDTDSSPLAAPLADHPLAVVRVVVDAGRPESVRSQLRAVGSLLGVRPSLERWARASGPHQVVLAGPRSFCAGVERAIEIVERALARFGRPVYVRRQIVHNAHVVADLEAKGAIFVTELDQVPDGATVVLAAHGVSPAVRAAAAARTDLMVIDATCPLVAKVHHEARRYLAEDYKMVLVGHADHEEVVGTMGEAPGRIALVERAEDVAALDFDDDDRVAYLTQTTLATDETATVVDALRQRFPDLVGPSAHDICYATQNRQDAVRALAARCQLVLVVGSTNSSNTARLVEVARREGCRAELLEDASALWLGWLDGVSRIGVTAGASAPEELVTGVVDALGRLGPLTLSEHRTTQETVQFALPKQVR
ncbi:MAG TPA: 4-hydroxy-3-methylbut-2-enyl diphosphate reductase [Acidimicrobiales bacterium]|jgi:4-hydroxy-3-methylbut-2-enyl diphosphate reductase|nr:4-hydroxy-3-methylbut-2-enyl diphosphate reductase [Acidimicrobiales bacterium]